MTLLDIRNPRTGESDYRIESADAGTIADVASRLRAAQPAWRELGFPGRIDAMRDLAGAIRKHSDALLDALSVDTGRTAIAKGEVDGIGGSIERWCGIAAGLDVPAERASSVFPQVGLRQHRVPFPLLGAISPWNFPLILSFIDATPALLAGCAVIIKPSEVTPRFAEPLRRAIAEVPALDAVLSIIDGDGGTGAALIGEVDAVAFTGSVATGRKVAGAAADRLIPAFLELGGKDPALVLEGADLERAATAILRASVNATGQACQSLERIYVNTDDHGEFVALISDKARKTPLTYPDAGSGIVGPLIFARQADTLRAHVDDALGKGAELVTGGEVRELGGGLYMEPTVLTGVTHDMLVMQEETFGPIMPIMAFETTEQAIELANDSMFGLSAAVFAGDEAEAIAVAKQLNAGGVSINDAGLTAFIFEAEKSAFRCSGVGPSRMGPSGLMRYFRHQAHYVNRGDVIPIEAFHE